MKTYNYIKTSKTIQSFTLIISIAVLLVVNGSPTLYAYTSRGTASWYSTKEGCLISQCLMADGRKLDDHAFTAAMRSHDFGKHYRVTNLKTGRSVLVTHTDYGPAKRLTSRVVDLSLAAYRAIDNPRHGLCEVSVESVSP